MITATLLGILLLVAFAASVVVATDVYLLAFLAVLCGVMFTKLSERLSGLIGLPYGVSLGITVVTSLILLVGTITLFGLRIEHAIAQTSAEVDNSFDKVKSWLDRHPPVKTALSRVPYVSELIADPDFGESKNHAQQGGANSNEETKSEKSDSSAGQSHGSQDSSRTSENTSGGSENTSADNTRSAAGESEPAARTSRQSADGSDRSYPAANIPSTGWASVDTASSRIFGVLGKLFSTTFGVTMNVAFVLFVGVFLSVKPDFYRDNLAILFPPSKRPRAEEILNLIGETLFNWLQGRAATMVITGVGTGIALYFLGVPLALSLGVITGILTFIPNIGAILGLVLSMLVAFSQGPQTVMWVVVAYVFLQGVESNLITPLIQQHQVSVPPPLLLSAQLMMGVLTGFLGVLVATPLVAAAVVVIREAYISDILEANED